MTIYVPDGSSWVEVPTLENRIYVDGGGVWTPAKQVYIASGGSWVLVWEGLPPSILVPQDFEGVGSVDSPGQGENTSFLSWDNAGRNETKVLEVKDDTAAGGWDTLSTTIGGAETNFNHIFSAGKLDDYADASGIPDTVTYRIRFTSESEFAFTDVEFMI